MNQRLRILYLGQNSGTSYHRAEALSRLGHRVDILDPWDFFPKNKLVKKILGKLVYEAGSAWLEPYIRQRLAASLKGRHYEVLWSDQCVLIGSTTAFKLRRHSDFMVSYSIDDPFGTRDKKKFLLYRKSLKLYDLAVVVRESNITEAYSYGARNVLRVFMSADERAHLPLMINQEEKARWSSEVAFIGTWMPERGPLLSRLIELGVPLTVYGNRWQKAQEWPIIKKAWRGPGLTGDDYVKAIQAAKLCLGLLSKGNRDLHTSRSAEIPYIGSLLCAERTAEHLEMYHEDKEAVFWSNPEECAAKCFALLSDGSNREAIARAGRKRCLANGFLNEPIMETILNTLFEQEREPLHSRGRSENHLP
jgi:hypothetical protein